MTLRRHTPLALTSAVAAMVLIAAAVCSAQGSPRRQVWRGTEVLEDAFNFGGRVRPAIGTPAEYRHRIVINFTYVEDVDERGRATIVSRKVSWTASGKSVAPTYETVTCEGSGGGELVGASDAARRDMLRIPCTVRRESNFFGPFQRPPTEIKPPALVSRDKLRDDCSYSEESPGRRYSVWLTGDFDAVIDVDARPGGAYASFNPAPGRALVFAAHTVPAMPALFKFVLDKDEVSHFPGYTSNARVTDVVLENAGLGHLKGQYQNDGPDWIFDEKDFSDRDKWGTVTPEEVETAREDTATAVTVTAMDYGAIGKLRAYVKVKCGGWQPVRIRFNGQDRDAIDIPMDEDHNLIADAMQKYSGDPGADADPEPVGKGYAGDGLTTFEEYRGFAVAGGDCASEGDDVVVRTDPTRKDLFVYAPDPELAAATSHFEWASGVTVHRICERHFVDKKQRIVNFTLQQANLREWHSKTISQRAPEHGLYINNEWIEGMWGTGRACVDPPPEGKCNADDTGPPKYTAVIMIDKPRTMRAGVSGLVSEITHETGHAVGLPHHSDRIVNWHIESGPTDIPRTPIQSAFKLLIEPGDGCQDPRLAGAQAPDVPLYAGEKFLGCGSLDIKVRGGPNSGEIDCPMRYQKGWYYEAPGSVAQEGDLVTYDHSGFPSEPTKGPVEVLSFKGRLFPYDSDNDPIPLGHFCSAPAGTGINDKSRGDRSHTGDAHGGNCQGMIVINDLVAPDRK